MRFINKFTFLAIALAAAFVLYQYTGWFKPAAKHAASEVKEVVNQVSPFLGYTKDTNNLDQAREAYNNGNIETAIGIYRDYILQNPGDPDAAGELGNVYYSAGRLQEAAQIYYDASIQLISRNESQRVQALLPLIAQINPALGADLQARLQQIAQSQTKPTLAKPAEGQNVRVAPQQSALRYY